MQRSRKVTQSHNIWSRTVRMQGVHWGVGQSDDGYTVLSDFHSRAWSHIRLSLPINVRVSRMPDGVFGYGQDFERAVTC